MDCTLVLQALLFMNFGQSVFVDHCTAHCFSMNTGGNVGRCNRTYNTAGVTDEEVIATQNYFGPTPFTWVLDARDVETIKILEKHWLREKTSTVGMHLNMHQLKESAVSNNSSVCVRQAISETDFVTWISIASSNYGYDRIELAKAIDFLIKRAPEGTIKLYLGYYNDTAVSSSMAVYHANQVISIHLVSTLAEYRKKGLGIAMLYEPLTIARGQGYQHAILMSSTAGKALAQKLGFTPYTHYLIFGNY